MANRLAQETSPYLRQHADNPVDWYPWGDEAFEVAHREDKPVLLSIGYSSCHWCHVMAHESFEDPDTAAVMNRYFVNIKVDREERPDVDAVYMDAVQAMTGHGGWPMTVVLDHERRPFFAGTYFPKASRGNMVGFVPLLERIHEVWSTERDKLLADAEKVATVVRRSEDLAAGSEIAPADSLEQAAQALQAQFDPQWGGFGSAPKFPQAMALDALLRHHVHTGEQTSLDMVTTSLDAMASGGIYDHLGGGFSRYSVDAHWLVPHFEKMLYDQATLTRAYLHAWQVTGEPRFQQVVQETIGYVLPDLRHPQGGFFSAEDADSEGEEGKFYTWTVDEIRSVLGADAAAAIEWYGVTEAGNFEGANILHRPDRGQLIRPEPVESARQRLLNHRATRIRPGLDDKVLTEWNALFLSVLAEAGAAMGRDDWIEAARANGQFLLDELRRPDGRWLRSWQEDGGARHLAYAADHAAVVDALIRLAEATGERGWIESACETADAMLELFWAEEGGLYTTGTDAERLLARQKDVLDNASPAANSLAALAMLRLGALTGSSQYSDRATAILALVGPAVARHPAAFGYMLAAVDLFHRGTTEIVVAGEVDGAVAEVQRRFLPNGVLAWGEPFESPLWEGRQEGHAYVCRNFTCQAPVTSSVDLAAQLDAA